jgi:hypothetical protein
MPRRPLNGRNGAYLVEKRFFARDRLFTNRTAKDTSALLSE